MAMRVGCVEPAVPGKTLEEKMEFLEAVGLWLELANDGTKTLDEIVSLLSIYKIDIKSVQAYQQHEVQLLAADEQEREAARTHVNETIKMAGEIGAKHVVVVAGYGSPGVAAPKDVFSMMLREFSALGEEFGVKIGLEPLGIKSSFLSEVEEAIAFLNELSVENVGIVVDTMHVISAGDDPAEILEKHRPFITEIQLRDTGSRAPGKGEIEFSRLGERLVDYFGLVCLEYKPTEDPRKELLEALDFIRHITSGKL